MGRARPILNRPLDSPRSPSAIAQRGFLKDKKKPERVLSLWPLRSTSPRVFVGLFNVSKKYRAPFSVRRGRYSHHPF